MICKNYVLHFYQSRTGQNGVLFCFVLFCLPWTLFWAMALNISLGWFPTAWNMCVKHSIYLACTIISNPFFIGFPGSSESKASACNMRDLGFSPWVGKIPWRRKWQPTPAHLPGKFHGWRRLVDQSPVQFSSVQLISCAWLFATPWTTACQASLSITNSQSSLKLVSIESVMPSNHLILPHPLFLLLSIFPSVRVFPNESSFHQMAKVLEFQLQH